MNRSFFSVVLKKSCSFDDYKILHSPLSELEKTPSHKKTALGDPKLITSSLGLLVAPSLWRATVDCSFGCPLFGRAA